MHPLPFLHKKKEKSYGVQEEPLCFYMSLQPYLLMCGRCSRSAFIVQGKGHSLTIIQRVSLPRPNHPFTLLGLTVNMWVCFCVWIPLSASFMAPRRNGGTSIQKRSLINGVRFFILVYSVVHTRVLGECHCAGQRRLHKPTDLIFVCVCLCVCVRACVCACVRVRVCVCVHWKPKAMPLQRIRG